ncbi:MAG: reverse transcriptase-like protein [Deltaproteobacteria bacterium]|nr:reverse transcriptase-like protein [Deltaproteobacteria bacterium]
MPWRRAEFKGAEVWAETDESGALKVERGIVQVRYSAKAGAKSYGGGASRITLKAAPAEELPPPASREIEDTTKTGPLKSSGKSRGSGFGKAGERTEAQVALAADAARKLISELSSRAVLCFTDGACIGNPGPAGSGAVVILKDGRRGEQSRSLGRATNNVGELTAILLALELLEEAGIGLDEEIAIFTDSAYSHGVLTKGWKAKANVELIEELRRRLRSWPNATLHWIAGHVGVDGNERADRLANDGASGWSRKSWGRE